MKMAALMIVLFSLELVLPPGHKLILGVLATITLEVSFRA
jgi:hypothetical protein